MLQCTTCIIPYNIIYYNITCPDPGTRLLRTPGVPSEAPEVFVGPGCRGRRLHTRNRHLRHHRGLSVAFSNGFSVAFSNGTSLFSCMFQRIVPCPVDLYWNCPMDFQWRFPMVLHFCDFGCNILP